ncbi:hypothetical protein CL617_05075 [archaeon]|nr:hypothetical protein [archaeon]|tara:strand:- start:2068 stop:2469 length:402 start_codon:yes stop_codon:yes gene_type:complete
MDTAQEQAEKIERQKELPKIIKSVIANIKTIQPRDTIADIHLSAPESYTFSAYSNSSGKNIANNNYYVKYIHFSFYFPDWYTIQGICKIHKSDSSQFLEKSREFKADLTIKKDRTKAINEITVWVNDIIKKDL